MTISWKSTFIIVFDLVIAAYLFMAFTSWHTPEREYPVCTKVVINIADENENGFLNSAEVKALLEHYKMYPLNRRTEDINTRQIEAQLVRMPFVNTAQCYITQEGHVCITITQRTPIVRVKSSRGEDYYVDDNGGVMPNSQYTSDMIIVTGNVSKTYACRYISLLAKNLMADDMWRNQIEQINLLPDNTIELVPRVGDHIVNIGPLPEASNDVTRAERVKDFVAKQLHRLELFYHHGLSHAGWNKYDYISLEYGNQVVCRRRENHN